jgi:endonuclease/exonuclease/phosphatase family metal-dependent hydrolase
MRIVTWNIQGGKGMDGRRSITRIAELLRELDADVICLQEVHQQLPWSWFQDQPKKLERLLDYKVIFGPAYRLGIGAYGNAVLSRLPVRSVSHYKMPNDIECRRDTFSWAVRRGLMQVIVETPQGPVAVMNTHWSLVANDRLASAEAIGEIVSQTLEPVILAGDLNARPNAAEIELLRNRTCLVDAGALMDTPTFRADNPTARIDYVFHSPTLEIRKLEVIPTLASDHLALIAEW